MGESSVYEIVALRRRPQGPSGDEGILWGQRLAGLVAEAPAGSRLEIMTWGDGSTLRVLLRGAQPDPMHGTQDLAREAALLLDPVASSKPAAADAPSFVGTTLRILPRGAAADLRDIGFAQDPGTTTPLWAEPRQTRSHELARLLLSYPGAVLVQTVESLSDDDVDEARQQSLASVMGVGPSVDDLVGTPVRVSASLVFPTSDGSQPLRLREHLRGWFNILDLDPADRVPFAGEGTIAPEWMAAGLLRFPTTSSSAFPGLIVEPPRIPLGVPAALADGIKVGTAVDVSGRPHDVRLPRDVMARHLHVLGETGSGKSTLLTTMAVETARTGEGFALIDPHGHTVDRVLRALTPEDLERTWIIRCGDPDNPVRLNPFSVSDARIQDLLISDLVDAFQVLFDPSNQGIVGPRFMHSMRYALLTLAEARGPKASLLDVPRLFSDPRLRRALLEHVADPDVHAFWTNDISGNRSNELNELIAWITSKFTTFASNRVVTQMLATGEDSFDPAEAMRSSRIILIDLGKGAVGTTGARMLGLIYLLRFWSAALSRHEAAPFTLFIDEAHTMSALTLPSILAEGRKFQLRAVLAHQYLGQLDPRLTDALRGSAGSRVAFRVGASDAEDLAQVLGPEFAAADLASLPRGTAAVRVADPGAPLRPFTLHVEHSHTTRAAGSELAVARAEAMSRSQLVDPYRNAHRLELEPAAETEPDPHRPPSDSTGSFLDDWLTRKKNERQSGPSLPAAEPALLLPAADRANLTSPIPAYVLGALLQEEIVEAETGPWARDALTWAGLSALPDEVRRGLLTAVHDQLTTRVGGDVADRAPQEAQDQSLALDEAGDPDPMRPLRPFADVPRIVADRQREILDELVACREKVLALALVSDDAPVDAWAVVADHARLRMALPPGDTSPPSQEWAEAARDLITATKQISEDEACRVALAVLDALPDVRPYGELVDFITRFVEGAGETDSALSLMVAVHRVAAFGGQVSKEVWHRHLASAERLHGMSRLRESADAYRFLCSLTVVAGALAGDEERAENGYAQTLTEMGALTAARSLFQPTS